MYLTLKQATEALKAVGVQNVRCTRVYKRADHREVLLEGWLPIEAGGGAGPKRGAQVKRLFTPLQASLHIAKVNDIWSYSTGTTFTSLDIFCKVQLTEPLY